ncbi:MAG: EamA family transporter [Clostridia bacterium]|nr:EamA family transporter [Clostridia bacterium]
MKKMGLLYIILASVLWGTSGIFVDRLAPYGITSLQMTFIRGLIAFVCMGVYVLIVDKSIVRTNFKEILLFMGSGVSFFLTASCYYQSMQLTSVSTAVVLMYTAPIFVMIYSVAFLGEKLSPLKLFAVIGMIVGCGLVSGIIGGFKVHPVGIAIGFLSGISYAAYNIFTKIEMQKGINPVKANFYCFLCSILVGAVAARPAGIVDCIGLNPPTVIFLSVGVGIVACILPYFLYTKALQVIPAGTATSLGILEPMAATIFSVLILGEKLSAYSVAGIVLILGMVFLLSREKQ